MSLQKTPPLLEAGVKKSQLEKAGKSSKKRCLLLPAQMARLHLLQHPRSFVLAFRRTALFGTDFLLRGSTRCWIQIGKRTTPKPTKIAACWCCNMCSYFSWPTNIENIWKSPASASLFILIGQTLPASKCGVHPWPGQSWGCLEWLSPPHSWKAWCTFRK